MPPESQHIEDDLPATPGNIDNNILVKLTRDLRQVVGELDSHQARFLVDTYYQLQDARIRAAAQERSVGDAKPHAVLTWLSDNNANLEGQVALALKHFAMSQPMGRWALGHKGIGPILAAGLMAHIDISKVQTVGQIWRYAGLDPTVKWNKGQKRPWNAALRTLCWKIGQSFMKVSGYADAAYGKVYVDRKAYEIARNERGENATTAAELLKAKKFNPDTDAFKHLTGGKLPPAQIDARARRYAVKLFLSHWFEAAYREHYKKEPPLPYPIAHLGHAKIIPAPKAVRRVVAPI